MIFASERVIPSHSELTVLQKLHSLSKVCCKPNLPNANVFTMKCTKLKPESIDKQQISNTVLYTLVCYDLPNQ